MRLANRTEEVELFKQMLLGKISKRILLIEAASGIGKSSLLDEFVAICPIHAEAALLAKIDLKGASTGIGFVFSRLQRQLGESHFRQFHEAINKFLSSGIEVDGNQIEGNGNRINIVLNVDNDEVRDIRLMQLLEAFFRDLQAIQKPIVIILDSFNLDNLTVANWISSYFLAEVANAENIWVVIAGQSVPTFSIEWMNLAERRYLDKIDDDEAWYSFLQANGLIFERETVKAFVVHLDGQPSKIVDVLTTVAKKIKK
jgi:hypothetical protein